MKCVWPRREQLLCVSLGAGSKIRSPFQLLMSRIQCGDGAARTDAEDEEHKPFSHAAPSSPYWPFSRRFWILPTHLRQVASGDARPLSLNPPTAFPPARRASPFIGRAPSTQHRPAPAALPGPPQHLGAPRAATSVEPWRVLRLCVPAHSVGHRSGRERRSSGACPSRAARASGAEVLRALLSRLGAPGFT